MDKMKIIKSEPDRCPVCGGYNTYVNDMEVYGDSLKSEYCCNDCEDVSWDEWFALRYVGYSMDGIDYDSNGNKEE